MEFIDVVKLRESTRKFSDEVIPEEVLTKILMLGWKPNFLRAQPLGLL